MNTKKKVKGNKLPIEVLKELCNSDNPSIAKKAKLALTIRNMKK